MATHSVFGIPFKQFRAMARNCGCSLRRVGKQYRVNTMRASESVAVYTTDPFVALRTMEEIKRGIDSINNFLRSQASEAMIPDAGGHAPVADNNGRTPSAPNMMDYWIPWELNRSPLGPGLALPAHTPDVDDHMPLRELGDEE